MKLSKIKVRMPKWHELKSASWAKELLMTFIGTTLSIILTFGTANYLEEKQKRADGRQTAMMVIHDMENAAEIFRNYAKKDEHSFNTAQYVYEHKANLDTIPSDSLLVFVQYVTSSAGQAYSYDDSSERTFLSTQDAWKNLDNATFIDQVQQFYHYRRTIYTMMQQDYLFERPVTNKEFHQLLLQDADKQSGSDTFYKNCVKNYLNRKDVELYVNYSFFRRRHYNQYADEFRSMANSCKFMMGISDDELAKYVQNKERTGKPLTEKKLIGTWQMESADDYSMEREYRSDHTYTTLTTQYLAYSCFTGRLIAKIITNATWELRGDSIYVVQLPKYTFELDRSQIHYTPEMEEAVNQVAQYYEQSFTTWLEEKKNQGEQRDTVFASIDVSGNKIEMRYKEGSIIYLTRSDRP